MTKISIRMSHIPHLMHIDTKSPAKSPSLTQPRPDLEEGFGGLRAQAQHHQNLSPKTGYGSAQPTLISSTSHSLNNQHRSGQSGPATPDFWPPIRPNCAQSERDLDCPCMIRGSLVWSSYWLQGPHDQLWWAQPEKSATIHQPFMSS